MRRYSHIIVSLFFLLCIIVVSAQTNNNTESDTLRIATYNIRIQTTSDTGNRSWANRKQYVGDIINNVYKFDLFGVQEIATSSQQNDLMSYLPGYSIFWKGRTNTAGTTGERSAIVYRTARFELLQTDWFFLSTTPDVYSVGWDAALSRICQWAKLRDKVTNQEFYFFNTHFDHVGSQARAESAKLVVSKIEEVTANQNLPVLLVGDLNFSTESGTIPYVAILNAGFRDSRSVPARRQVTGPVGTGNGWDMAPTSYTESKRIDYLFVNHRIDVHSYTTIDKKYVSDAYPSDHFPVMITATIKEEISGTPNVKPDSQVKLYVIENTLRFESELPYTYNVFNSIGVMVASKPDLINEKTIFRLDNLSDGIYFVRTTTSKGKTISKIMIK